MKNPIDGYRLFTFFVYIAYLSMIMYLPAFFLATPIHMLLEDAGLVVRMDMLWTIFFCWLALCTYWPGSIVWRHFKEGHHRPEEWDPVKWAEEALGREIE